MGHGGMLVASSGFEPLSHGYQPCALPIELRSIEVCEKLSRTYPFEIPACAGTVPARGRCLRGDDFRCHAEASGRRLTASATDPDSEYPQGWPTGFKPAVTGATSQRVKTFRHGHTCGYSELVSHNRLELLSPGCKPGVLPLDQWEIGGARQIQTAISPLARRVLSRLSYGPVSGVSWQIRTAVS